MNTAWSKLPRGIVNASAIEFDEDQYDEIMYGEIPDDHITDMLRHVMTMSVVDGMEHLCTQVVWDRVRFRIPGLPSAREVFQSLQLFESEDSVGAEELISTWIEEAGLQDDLERILNRLADILQWYLCPVLMSNDLTDIDPSEVTQLADEIIRIKTRLCHRNFRRINSEIERHRKRFDTAHELAWAVLNVILNHDIVGKIASVLREAGFPSELGELRSLDRDVESITASITDLLTVSAVKSLGTRYQFGMPEGILFSPDSRMARKDPTYIDWSYLQRYIDTVCLFVGDYIGDTEVSRLEHLATTRDQLTELLVRFHQCVLTRLQTEGELTPPTPDDEDVRMLVKLQVELIQSLLGFEPPQSGEASRAA